MAAEGRTVQVSVSLPTREQLDQMWNRARNDMTIPRTYDGGMLPVDAFHAGVAAMSALLSQPTPTAEPIDAVSASCVDGATPEQQRETAEPPRIEDMAPGTTFTAAASSDVWRWAVRQDGQVVSGLGIGPKSSIDPSTIRDVTPPRSAS
ncbi:hypothetical protein [Curtobacterium sp. BRD11]|uniref:hypothetical protein n=1 Tax=Curtobacterium sp. BRD11 TaxID=2962581 RepID=UPI002881279E|nr:hypothetical protein [Curtobacterium sp. BRD11]MDT0211220.1 hypothetical protein [Curtobacterium sp. BRD11]